MTKKENGGLPSQIKTEKYISEILLTAPSIYKYEVPLIIRAFYQTVRYFFMNAIEFGFNDLFEFKKIHVKPTKYYSRILDEIRIIPEHDEIKFKTNRKLKDYLNSRNKFKNALHREKLPGNARRNENIF